MRSALWNRCGPMHEVDGHVTALKIETSAEITETKRQIHKESQGLYELADLIRMERKFLDVLNEHLDRSAPAEDALYEALVATVVVLKDIHEATGETCYYEPIAKADYGVVREQGFGLAIVRVSGPMSLGQLLAQLFGGNEESDELKRHRDEMRRRAQN